MVRELRDGVSPSKIYSTWKAERKWKAKGWRIAFGG